jgi:hypothetical protein
VTRLRASRAALWLAVLLAVSMAAAQESEPQDDASTRDDSSTTDPGRGYLFVEIIDWIAQPTGLEYRVASVVDPLDPFGGQVVSLEHDTESTFNYRVGYEFPNDNGAVIFSYLSQKEESELEVRTAGLFLYGEINTSGFLSGVNNDALADGFSGESRTRLRDVRLDYYRTAFKGKRVSGKWFVGARRVNHDRKLESEYFALAPNLPPIIPPISTPRLDLAPRSDSAVLISNWSGRGVEAGLDFKVALSSHAKVWFESGLAVAVLRGKADTSYSSETHFYGLMNGDVIAEILEPPYDEFSELDPMGVPIVNDVAQIAGQVGVQSTSESVDADVIETYLAVRWKFWKMAEFVAGFRNISYQGVGIDVRTDRVEPEAGMEADEFKADGTRILRLNPSTLKRTEHSADYEGFYFGLAFRF